MKRLLFFTLICSAVVVCAQTKIPRNANRFVYQQIEYGEDIDTSFVTVIRYGNFLEIHSPKPTGTLINGYAAEVTYVDYDSDSVTVIASFSDSSSYYYRRGLSRNDIEWKVDGSLHSCSINSNSLVFDMDEKSSLNVNPMPQYGLSRGVLRSFTRNGQTLLKLVKAEYDKEIKQTVKNLPNQSQRVAPRDLDRIKKDRLVITTRIFDHEQICWGKENAKISDASTIPHDSVLHYAGGTLILKRIKLPILPYHYQHFVELHQQSNGDAYDRTGSVFIIPSDCHPSFFDGINQHPDSLPIFIGRDGQRYQGIVIGFAVNLRLSDAEQIHIRTVNRQNEHRTPSKSFSRRPEFRRCCRFRHHGNAHRGLCAPPTTARAAFVATTGVRLSATAISPGEYDTRARSDVRTRNSAHP